MSNKNEIKLRIAALELLKLDKTKKLLETDFMDGSEADKIQRKVLYQDMVKSYSGQLNALKAILEKLDD